METLLQSPSLPAKIEQKRGTFVEVRSSEGKLLFKLDPERELIQVVQRGEVTLIDLREYGLVYLAS